jgi:hypothetical protein
MALTRVGLAFAGLVYLPLALGGGPAQATTVTPDTHDGATLSASDVKKYRERIEKLRKASDALDVERAAALEDIARDVRRAAGLEPYPEPEAEPVAPVVTPVVAAKHYQPYSPLAAALARQMMPPAPTGPSPSEDEAALLMLLGIH